MTQNTFLTHLQDITHSPQNAYVFLTLLHYMPHNYGMNSCVDNQANYNRLLMFVKEDIGIEKIIDFLNNEKNYLTTKFTDNYWDIFNSNKRIGFKNALNHFHDTHSLEDITWSEIEEYAKDIGICFIPDSLDNTELAQFKKKFNFNNVHINVFREAKFNLHAFEHKFDNLTALLSINNNNLGLGEISLIWNTPLKKDFKGLFTPISNTIDASTFTVFTHEWAHALDHNAYKKIMPAKTHKGSEMLSTHVEQEHTITQIMDTLLTPQIMTKQAIEDVVYHSIQSMANIKKKELLFQKIKKMTLGFSQYMSTPNFTSKELNLMNALIIKKDNKNRYGNFFEISSLLDQIHYQGNGYFQNKSEIFARAFEAFVAHKSRENGDTMEYGTYGTNYRFPQTELVVKTSLLFQTLIDNMTDNNVKHKLKF